MGMPNTHVPTWQPNYLEIHTKYFQDFYDALDKFSIFCVKIWEIYFSIKFLNLWWILDEYSSLMDEAGCVSDTSAYGASGPDALIH